MRRSVPLLLGMLGRELLAAGGDVACVGCGVPHAAGLCPSCATEAGLLDSARSTAGTAVQPLTALSYCGRYHRQDRHEPTHLALALTRFKYEGDRACGRVLARLFAHTARPATLAADGVVPVPLHPRRLRARGFNQAAWLARSLALAQRLPLVPDALHRRVDTLPQARLGARERRIHARDLFAAHPRLVRGRSLLLVDDVFTTGSTIRACAHRLLDAGAARVAAVVLLIAEPSRVDP